MTKKYPSLLSSRNFWKLIVYTILVLAIGFFMYLLWWNNPQLTLSKLLSDHRGWTITIIVVVALVFLAKLIKDFKLAFLFNSIGVLFFCLFLWAIYPSSKKDEGSIKNEQKTSTSTTIRSDKKLQTKARTPSRSPDVRNDPRLVHYRDSLAKVTNAADRLTAKVAATKDSVEKEAAVQKILFALQDSLCRRTEQLNTAKLALAELNKKRAAFATVANPCDLASSSPQNRKKNPKEGKNCCTVKVRHHRVVRLSKEPQIAQGTGRNIRGLSPTPVYEDRR